MLLVFLCCQALDNCEQDLYETISQDWQAAPVKYALQSIELIASPALNIVPPVGLSLYDKDEIARAGMAGYVIDWMTVIPLKLLVNRARPDGTADRLDSSFPSGHTTFAFTQAVIYSHHYPRLRVPLFVYAALVGFSRVYLAKHYPSDVLGGAVLGAAVGLVVVRFGL